MSNPRGASSYDKIQSALSKEEQTKAKLILRLNEENEIYYQGEAEGLAKIKALLEEYNNNKELIDKIIDEDKAFKDNIIGSIGDQSHKRFRNINVVYPPDPSFEENFQMIEGLIKEKKKQLENSCGKDHSSYPLYLQLIEQLEKSFLEVKPILEKIKSTTSIKGVEYSIKRISLSLLQFTICVLANRNMFISNHENYLKNLVQISSSLLNNELVSIQKLIKSHISKIKSKTNHEQKNKIDEVVIQIIELDNWVDKTKNKILALLQVGFLIAHVGAAVTIAPYVLALPLAIAVLSYGVDKLRKNRLLQSIGPQLDLIAETNMNKAKDATSPVKKALGTIWEKFIKDLNPQSSNVASTREKKISPKK